MPDRDGGFYPLVSARFIGSRPDRRSVGSPGCRQELDRLERAGISPLESILESLELLGVGRGRVGRLPAGHAAGAARLGRHDLAERSPAPTACPVPVPPGSLVEFLAVRLILDRLALAHVARQDAADTTGPLDGCGRRSGRASAKQVRCSVEQRAFLVFQLAQVLGWYPPALYHLSKRQWSTLVAEIESFGGLERRRIFHLAFERRFRTQTLDALSVYTRRAAERVSTRRDSRPCFASTRARNRSAGTWKS